MAPQREIRIPAVPGEPPRSPFPLMACVAPVIAAGVIWAITRSPFALVFAVLGPVMAIASLVDGRRFARRTRRRQLREYESQLGEAREQIGDAKRRERIDRMVTNPTAREVLSGSAALSRWRAAAERRRTITVGLGERGSGVRLTGAVGDAAHAELTESASLLVDAPCTVNAGAGVGVVGPLLLARAVARGYLLQLCHAGDPTRLCIVSVPDDGWEWARALPHTRRTVPDDAVRVRVVEDAAAPAPSADVTIAVSRSIASVPSDCAEIVECAALSGRWTSATDPARSASIAVHPVTEAAAAGYARVLARLAADTGLSSDTNEPPDAVAWADLRARASGFRVPLGRTARSVVEVDLIEHGPHAIIGGTTGSGKSELLATWALGIAAGNSPSEAALLLVDFKGGATFAPLQRLPHVVGVITDLDPSGATRALESLRAEIRFRERTLREHGVTDVSDAEGTVGRLVIIVDEFAAMLEGFPELHALFTDIAARGRSLGMHLILCTQRPAGVVRDSLLANCALRLSLRVNNRADSVAVTGVDTAMTLPADPQGRCVVVADDADPVVAQVARADQSDIEAVAAAHAGAAPPRRPWLDPLPDEIPLSELSRSPDAFTLGMRDLPARQAQERALWRPDRDGSLLVLGGARSGKSVLARAVEEQGSERWNVEVLPDDLERAFDLLDGLQSRLDGEPAEQRHRGTVLVVDDLDALLAAVGDEDAEHVKAVLLRLLRSGPRAGAWVVATAQRLGAGTASLAAAFDGTILLRLPTRQEHILAGGDSATWSAERPAGRASWNGEELQLAATDGGVRDSSRLAPPQLTVDDGETMAVVCRRPAETAAALRQRHPGAQVVTLAGTPSPAGLSTERATIVVGDIDAWQSNWSLLGGIRHRATLVVEACSSADYRLITRSRVRPPYLHGDAGRAWRIAVDGVITRCLL